MHTLDHIQKNTNMSAELSKLHENTKLPDENQENVKLLRRILDLSTTEEINTALLKYSEIMELMHCKFPTMPIDTMSDWAIAQALSPEWYGDALIGRVQNTMLVSALLITVTAASFLSPPFYNLPNQDVHSSSMRAFFYTTGFCNVMFLISIFSGISFVENAMCRSYCTSDRFGLIVKLYGVLNISQTTSTIGAVVFPLTLAIPMSDVYCKVDATVMWIFTVVYLLCMLFVTLWSAKAAGDGQAIRRAKLAPLIGTDGRLLEKYYPAEGLRAEEYRDMFK